MNTHFNPITVQKLLFGNTGWSREGLALQLDEVNLESREERAKRMREARRESYGY